MFDILKELTIFSPFIVSLFSFLSLYIRFRKGNKANLVMSVFMLCATIFYFFNILKYFNLLQVYNWFHTLYFALLMLACPQPYFYVNCLITGNIKDRFFIYHFATSFIVLIIGSFLYFALGEQDRILFLTGQFSYHLDEIPRFHLINLFFNLFKKIFASQVIFYVILGWLLLRKHQKELNNVFSYNSGYKLNWVKFYVCIMALWAFFGEFGYYHIINQYSEIGWIKYLANFLICSIIFSVYLLASMQRTIVSSETENEAKIEIPIDYNHYKLKEKILQCFEQKEIFLKTDLTIWDLCRETNSNRTYISNVINEEFGVNFNCFVNKYRVQKAKELLYNKNISGQNLEKLALMAGFNSIISFNRAFKQFENISPRNFRKGLCEKNL